jgi:uncharacterized glyoxalase superfamily protein PhnB
MEMESFARKRENTSMEIFRPYHSPNKLGVSIDSLCIFNNTPLLNDEAKMPKVSKLFPVFAVSNLDVAVAYYQEKLGFNLAWTWGQPATRAGVALDDVQIQLDAGGAGAPSGPSVVYCHMSDVDAYYHACVAKGAVFSLELGQRPWGMRDFRVIDPDGNRVGFGEEG